jgi:signal transduction histidine kinase
MNAVVTTGLIMGVAAMVFEINDGTHSSYDTALSGTTGFLFVAAGAISHARRPANPIGLLIALVGVAIFMEDLKLSKTPLVFSIGGLVTSASSALIAHLAVAFPHGTLESRRERWLVASGYGTVFGCALGQVLFTGPRSSGPDDVRNVLVIRDEPGLSELFGRLLVATGTAVSLGVVVLLVYRWIAGALHQRHLLGPVLVIALVGAIASALSTTLASTHPWGSDHPLAGLLADVYRIAFCLWPLAFLLGVRRAKVAPTEMTRLLAERDGQALADLVAGDEVWRDSHSVETLNAAALLVRDNQRLTAKLEEQLAEVQASRARIVSACDAERRRFERDLHDGAQQRIVAVVLGLRMARQRLGSDVDPAISALLSTTVKELLAAVVDLRELAAGIRPAILTEAGPVAAVRALLERTPIPVDFPPAEIARMDTTRESTAYFVVTEALTNALKHARADRIRVEFHVEGDQLHIDVADNGIGGADISDGSGLRNLRDRVRALDGELTVYGAPGSGTTVSAVIPLAK